MLASLFRLHYLRTGNTEEIALRREQQSLLTTGHPGCPLVLSNLATSLSLYYKETGSTEILEEAILLSREALSLCPPGHHDRVLYRKLLFACLDDHYRLTGKIQSRDEALSLLATAV
jgi:hypothetical protein